MSEALYREFSAFLEAQKAKNRAKLAAQAAISVAPAVTGPEPTLEDYIKALRGHDWWFDFSDDHSVWSKGRASLSKLQTIRGKLDPNYYIWNRYAPEQYRV